MKRDSSSPVGSLRNVGKWIICNSDRIDIHLAVDCIVAERHESISFDIEIRTLCDPNGYICKIMKGIVEDVYGMRVSDGNPIRAKAVLQTSI